MSIAAMNAVWDAPLEPTGLKLTALALADMCNDSGGSLFPSMKTIARRVGVSRSQAQRNVHKLIEAGLLSVIANENGGAHRSTRHYHLHIDRLRLMHTGSADATGSAGATGSTDAEGGPHVCMEGVAPMRHTGSIDATQTVKNHQGNTKEPSAGADFDARASLLSAGATVQPANDWIAMRKRKHADVTPDVIEDLKREATKAGWQLDDVLRKCVARNWTNFEARWVQPSRSNLADVAQITTPTPPGAGDALKKLKQDDKLAVPPPPEVRAQIALILRGDNASNETASAEREAIGIEVAWTPDNAPTGSETVARVASEGAST